ncbi:hypothetical protein ACHAW6_011409 [Cyclotella cf. meneghiniana]
MEQLFNDIAEDLGVKTKDEDETSFHPYAHLEKSRVLQDARIFHDSEIVRRKPRKCCTILAKILYIQNNPATSQASTLTQVEATDLFFAATKLFVSSDTSLRRLVYLFIKEIIPLCDPSDVIIVTSCLTKDMTSNIGLYRSNAIRALVNIIDSSMLGSIERYIKQAIVDNDPRVSNSALVAASHWFTRSSENKVIIKRWVGEVREALLRKSSKKHEMVQMNAMRLLVQMKGKDRLGICKLVQQFSGHAGKGLKSPLALVILIRACGELIREELSAVGSLVDIREVSSLCKLGFEFLEASLSHSEDLISFEAARTISSFHTVEAQNLVHAIDCLQKMLISDRSKSRIAAVKTLSATANHHPRAVARCNEGLEKCVEDSNKQIATMAVGTLLKTGNEQVLDRLMLKLDSIVEAIPEEEKISLVSILRDMCIQYPSKYQSILRSLSSFLSREGTFEFKHSIVNCITSLMQQFPEASELCLAHLCEYIEDCEYSMLSTKIMHIIGKFGPSSSQYPSRYIRFLYNRIMLDNAIVRAAAVSTLVLFASSCPSLRLSILPLLRISCMDENDEVRDRSSIAVKLLEKAIEANPYKPPDIEAKFDELPPNVPADGDLAAYAFLLELPVGFDQLKRSIEAYNAVPGVMYSDEALTLSCLHLTENSNGQGSSTAPGVSLKANGPSNINVRDPAGAVYAIPELSGFGRVFRSSQSIAMTEEETEYVVRCTKHILDHHVILQFSIHNTVECQMMRQAVISVDIDSDLYEIIGDIPADKISYGDTVSCFCVLHRKSEDIFPVTLSCQLHFVAFEMDPESNEPLSSGYEEEYTLEDLIIGPADFMAKSLVVDFGEEWNNLLKNEAKEKFLLQFSDVGKAVPELLCSLGMVTCDGTNQVRTSTAHMLHLSGTYVGGHTVLARAQLLLQNDGVLVKIAVRSELESICRSLLSCIR